MLVIDLALRLFAYQMDEDSVSGKRDLRILIQSHEFDCTLFYFFLYKAIVVGCYISYLAFWPLLLDTNLCSIYDYLICDQGELLRL